MNDLTTIITQKVHDWSQWSPAERQKLEVITEEILFYVRDGIGNRFIKDWCTRELASMFQGHPHAPAP